MVRKCGAGRWAPARCGRSRTCCGVVAWRPHRPERAVVEQRAQVLIVGAGPTGLVLALWLTRLGVPVRIIDKTTEPGTTSRAVAVQARTLEFYRQIGLADAVIARGHDVAAANMWVAGRHVARAVFGDMGAGISPDRKR